MVTIRHASFNDVAVIHVMIQAVYAEYRAVLPHSSLWNETPQTVAAEMKLGPILLSIAATLPYDSCSWKNLHLGK
jgi:hypothetical protein